MPVKIRRLLLDALKPRELSIVELSKGVGSADGVQEIDIIVSEVDSRTETIKVTIRGAQIDYNAVSKAMEKYGVSIRGVDEINVTRV